MSASKVDRICIGQQHGGMKKCYFLPDSLWTLAQNISFLVHHHPA
jgi:hypothetical protein